MAGLVWMLTIGTFTSGDLGRARRAAATRAIGHGQMVALQEMELTSVLARTTARQRTTSPVWLVTFATTTGLLLLSSGGHLLELVAAAVIAVGAAANISTVFAIGRAQRWLDQAHRQT